MDFVEFLQTNLKLVLCYKAWFILFQVSWDMLEIEPNKKHKYKNLKRKCYTRSWFEHIELACILLFNTKNCPPSL